MNRIQSLRKAALVKQTDLAKAVNVSPAALSGYETGKYEADIETYMKIADFFGVSLDYLLGASNTPQNKESAATALSVPVLGDVAAGIPIEAVQDIVDYEEIDSAMAAGGEYFGLRIKGASMEPRMREGDVVIVRKQDDVESGDVAVVMVNGDNATVKRIKKGPSGITLIPNNPVFDPMFYTNDEIQSLPVHILGKVVELRAKF